MAFDRDYLLSLQAVRDQAAKVYNIAKEGKLKHFDFNPIRMQDVASYVSKLIDVSTVRQKRHRNYKLIELSVTLARINMQASLPMVAGSILRWAR